MFFCVDLGQGAIIAQEAARSKGAPNRPDSAPVSSSVASRAIPYLCALACGPLTSFPSRLRPESCYPSFVVPG
jgi:hypothetical protein